MVKTLSLINGLLYHSNIFPSQFVGSNGGQQVEFSFSILDLIFNTGEDAYKYLKSTRK